MNNSEIYKRLYKDYSKKYINKILKKMRRPTKLLLLKTFKHIGGLFGLKDLIW